MRIEIGMTIITSYGTGPYVVKEIVRGCTCPEYVRSLNGDNRPSEPHIHIVCEKPEKEKEHPYYLNGYRSDGSNVWSNDRIMLTGKQHKAIQLTLFD